MGIQTIKTPHQTPDAGMFNLPPEFDTKLLAAEWVEERNVNYKTQRQTLLGTNKTADGWALWREGPKEKPITVTTGKNVKYFLMCRPREVQDQVNAIFGNVSKININKELEGQTIEGKSVATVDPGMLGEERIKNAMPGERSEVDQSKMELNEVESAT